jgi:tetratricopeptide (TPR) repeat protein
VTITIDKLLVLALALASSMTAACRTTETPDEPEPPKPAPARADAAPSLQEIADAIDPGPRAALTVAVPAWISAALQLPTKGGDPQAMLTEARSEWDRFQSGATGVTTTGDAATLEKLVPLARALALAERAGGNIEDAPVDALLVLERVYDTLDAPMLANDRNLFARMIQTFVTTLAQQGEAQGSAALEELANLVFGTLQKSGDLHHRTVAALLRRAPGHPDVPDVLGRLAPSLMAEDEALAVGVLHRSLALRGDTATAAHWLDLSGLCSRALDVRCARAALSRAETLAPTTDDKLQKRLTDERAQVKRAHRAVELEDSAGIDDGLERGKALTELQRYPDARATFEQLVRRHPDDARPVVGLARVELMDGFDFVGAAEIVDRAQPREHLDREWYELAIGVRATALIYHVLPQVADREPDQILELLRPSFLQMKQDIDALEALGSEDGRVLRFVYDVAMEALPKLRGEDAEIRTFVQGMLPRAQALRIEVPGSAYAYTLVLAAAELTVERASALAVLDLAPPPEHAQALAFRRAQAAFDLVAAWDADDRVDTMLALVDAVADAPQPLAARRLAVDGHVLARRLGKGRDELPALEQRYRSLLAESGGESDAVLHNNLAVVVAEQGRIEEAQVLWGRASELADDDTRIMPRLNVIASKATLVLAGKAEPVHLDRLELTDWAENAATAEVRLQARAWLAALAAKPERRKAERALRDAALKEAATNYRPRNLPSRSGVILRASAQMGLGYSTVNGLEIQLDLSGVPWLVLPCPVAIPQAPAKPKPR